MADGAILDDPNGQTIKFSLLTDDFRGSELKSEFLGSESAAGDREFVNRESAPVQTSSGTSTTLPQIQEEQNNEFGDILEQDVEVEDDPADDDTFKISAVTDSQFDRDTLINSSSSYDIIRNKHSKIERKTTHIDVKEKILEEEDEHK